MDVHCSTCREPWDVYHLRHEAIFETDLRHEEAEVWLSLPRSLRMLPRYRGKLRAVGWEFGASVYDVIHCPCCPPGARLDPEAAALKASIAEALGDDEDGLASEIEEAGL